MSIWREERCAIPTNKVVWKYRPHTEAKHTVLRRFLEARLAIMGQVKGFPELVMIDGFAGPGRYIDGEKGSPLLMLDTFLEHIARDKITAQLRYVFIEKHPGRFAYLQSEIAKYRPTLPPNVSGELYPDPFDTRMDAILKELGTQPPPVFTFVDPFGISDNHHEVTSQVLGHRGCEVLVYVPLYDIARHIGEPEFEPHLGPARTGSLLRRRDGGLRGLGRSVAGQRALSGRNRAAWHSHSSGQSMSSTRAVALRKLYCQWKPL